MPLSTQYNMHIDAYSVSHDGYIIVRSSIILYLLPKGRLFDILKHESIGVKYTYTSDEHEEDY